MPDWSEIFEQRLQTVLQDGKGQSGKRVDSTTSAFPDFDLHLTPSPTHNKVATDPTGAFFESIRNQSRSCGQPTTNSYAVGSGSYAFQHGESSPSSSSSRAITTPAAQVIRALSPTMDINRPDLKGLQGRLPSGLLIKRHHPNPCLESYSTRAEELYAEATSRMASAQDQLEAELGGMAQKEDAFLSSVADKQAHFSRPAEDWMVKVQTRETNGSGGVGGPAEMYERIVDRIAMIRAAAATLEGDLEKLWAEWGQAHSEATDVLQAMAGDNNGAGGDDEERDQILAKAKKELDAAVAEATREMKENEKVGLFLSSCSTVYND
jgi:hypothetical protein